MPTLSAKQIATSLKTPATTGAQVSVQQVRGILDKELQRAGAALRAVILAYAQVGHRTPISSNQSELAQGTRVSLDTDGLRVDLPDFADELDRGRKPGTYPPYRDILAWVLKYRISSLPGPGKARLSANQLAFAIQRGIYKRGIRARPFLADAEAFATDLMEQLIDTVILPSLVQPLAATFSDQ